MIEKINVKLIRTYNIASLYQRLSYAKITMYIKLLC